MATIPLMVDEDVELGHLPDYNDAVNAKKAEAKSNLAKTRSKFDIEFGSDTFSGTSVALASVSIRLGFLRKVFGILSFQLLTTVVTCIILYLSPNVRAFLQHHPFLVFATLISSFILLFAMYVNAHNVPLNYLLLTAWTIIQSVAVATVVSYYNVEVVIEATGLTTLVVISLFIYTLQSKRDFQKYYGTLFGFLMAFFAASFVQLFLQTPAFNFLMSVLGAGLFSAYLVLDLDRVMRHSSPEDYIEAMKLENESDVTYIRSFLHMLGTEPVFLEKFEFEGKAISKTHSQLLVSIRKCVCEQYALIALALTFIS